MVLSASAAAVPLPLPLPEQFLEHPARSSVLALGVFLTLYHVIIYRLGILQPKTSTVKDIPGPASRSWIFGNMHELLAGQAGEKDLEWQRKYGTIVKIKGQFGQDVLMVSDPKAMHHIYQASGYRYPKPSERVTLQSVVNGKGIAAMSGEDHRRHRRVMLPAFGGPAVKEFIPIFTTYAGKLGNVWRELIFQSKSDWQSIDVLWWSSRAMLDALGEAAFDYNFGALDNSDNPLAKAYMKVALILFGRVTKPVVLFSAVAQMLPMSWLAYMVEHSSAERLVFSRYTRDLATSVTREIVIQKTKELEQGAKPKDILSILIKANLTADEKTMLSEEELYAQLRTILIAGHETSSTTLSWTLFELCKLPSAQTKLREEIRLMEAKKGGDEFTLSDFETMPYLQAVTKEILRYHTAAYNSYRISTEQDVIPLAYPIMTASGETMKEIPVEPGQRFITSIAAYNRLPDIWGPDAEMFNPDRWLKTTSFKSSVGAPNIGVFNNTFTFLGGNHACTGWRFAVVELQCFLVDLISKFEFSVDPHVAKNVRREAAGVMSPTIAGDEEKGFQLPLLVRLAPRDL